VTISRYLGLVRGYPAVYGKDLFLDSVIEMVWNSIVIEGSYAFLVDMDNHILVHTRDNRLLPTIADGEMFLTNILDVYTYAQLSCIQGDYCGIMIARDNVGASWSIAAREINETGWLLFVAVPQRYVSSRLVNLMFTFSMFWLPSIILLVSLIIFATKKIVSNPFTKQLLIAINQEKQALLQSQKFLDMAPFFVEVWDKHGNLIDCNEPTMKLFGLSDKSDFIKHYYDFSPKYQACGTLSTEKIRNHIAITLAHGSSRMDWIHIGPNGELIPVDSVLARMERGDETIITIYTQDLRPLKEALEREKKAENESHAKTQFLSRMSHEIRTPMNSIMGIAAIELRKTIHSPKTKEAFQRIRNASKLLLSLINDILDLSKVEAGKMEITPVAYDTASLIADTVQLNLMYTANKEIQFRLDVDENLPTRLIGDELRIKQILNNLLSNAFKYTTEGTITLSLGLAAAPSNNETMLVIRVSDTGQGMSEEQLARLFDTEYKRFNLSQNRSVEGAGLGMAITYSLVTIMDGEIKVDSKVGSGTNFTIQLPQGVESAAVLGSTVVQSLQRFEAVEDHSKNSELTNLEPMPYGKVLVVDDVETNLYVVKAFLDFYEIDVELAESATEAIDRIKEGKVYDIIFMDHMMPGMDGITATNIIRKMGYDHPIIALTANATVGASQMFMDNGFSGFISKPFDIESLNAYLVRFIKDKHERGSL